MVKNYFEIMSQHSDKELAEILTIKRSDYNQEAIDFAQAEFNKRHLNISNILTEDDIKKTESERTVLPIKDQKLHWFYKLLTFLLPEFISAIVPFICIYILQLPIVGLLSLPLSIVLQVSIFRKLKTAGYDKMASDFKNWSLNSWIFLVLLFILEMILKHL